MNFKRKLLIFLTLLYLVFPINLYAYTKFLIPGGENIGIKVNSDGVLVVGFYSVNNKNIAYNSGVRIGDKIIKINDVSVSNIENMSEIISNNNYMDINLIVKRNNKNIPIKMKLVKEENGIYKTGMYVKDSITGIGTVTFITEDNKFGALGHEITENNTNTKFEIKSGKIYDSSISSISKSTKKITGEKNARIDFNKEYGVINKNLETGIFGTYNKNVNRKDLIEILEIEQVKIGKAEIITVLNDNVKETFDIEILSINPKDNTKNFLIRITDPELLNKTGGIIKGMSGSPIIQNGKLIGAVTHAIVGKPDVGYGISVIKMLESME